MNASRWDSWARLHRRCALASALGVGMLLAGAPAHAQSLAQCRAIADAAARLACYDAMPGPALSAAGALPAASKSLPASTGGDAAKAAATAAAEFGFEKPAPRPEDLRSSIPGAFTGWEPRSRFRLANGQIWEIADGSRAAYSLNSPGVRIVRGMLGSFHLEVDGVNQRPRVRRIE